MDAGIFSEEPPDNIHWDDRALPATSEQMLKFQTLDKFMQEVTRNKLPDDC